MSVTFSITGTPSEAYHPDPIDEPDWVAHRLVAGWPWLNLSNTNATAFLRGFEAYHNDELCGEWSLAKCQEIRERIVVFQENPSALETETVVEGNFTFFGRDLGYVTSRLGDFLELVDRAIKEGRGVEYT